MTKYRYDINSTHIKITDYYTISNANELMRAILLNTSITEHLPQLNEQIEGWSPLMIAVLCSNTWSSEQRVTELIAAGAKLDLKDKCGRTALMWAAQNSRTDSTENTVKILLDAGAKLDLKDRFGLTALMWTVMYARTFSTENTVKILIAAGANLYLEDRYEITALMWAAQNSGTESTENTVKLLINKLNIINYIDCSPIIN